MQNKFERWQNCWLRYLLGENWKPNTKFGKEIIRSLDDIAEVGEAGGMYADPSHVSFMSPLFALRARAIAFCTSGTKTHNNPVELQNILTELERIHTEYYNLQTSFDNWWAVEIGEPLRLLDILYLLYEQLPNRKETITQWTDIILHFQDAYSLTSRGQTEIGANLMWKCHIMLLTGILRREQSLIDWANEQLPTILRYSSAKEIPGMGMIYQDGFFPDGSFIQHHFFAYTGGYGKHLLAIYSGLVYAFAGEDCLTLPDENKAFLYQAIHDSYAPLLVNGHFMDLARGREVSRSYFQDDICAKVVLRALCYLRQVAPPEEKQYLTALLKQHFSVSEIWDDFLKDESPFTEYFVQPSLAEILEEIECDSTLPLPAETAHYNFGCMCKVVHRTPKWSAGIGMYSKNIACYEALNGESVGLWHFSDGVIWLYTADASQYCNGFYATVDRQRLPGVTVDRSPNRAQDPYYSWFMPESKNVCGFSGGVSLFEFGSAGLQYLGQGNGKERDLNVKKSWFFLGDEIVCLGSGITSTTGNPIETIINNYRLLPGANNLLTLDDTAPISCKELLNTKQTAFLQTLHITGNNGCNSDIGYYFPKRTQLDILCEHRIGSWNQLTLDENPDFQYENDFTTFWINHGENPANASYAYVILPAKNADDTSQYALEPAIEVLENTSEVHAVHHKKNHITAIHFWSEVPTTAAGITCNTQSCIMLQTMRDYTNIAISDPTKENRIIEFAFDFNAQSIVQSDEGIEVLSFFPLRLKVDTTDMHGQSKFLSIQM